MSSASSTSSSSPELSDSQENKRGIKRKRNSVAIEVKPRAKKPPVDSDSLRDEDEDEDVASNSDSGSESSPDEDAETADDDVQVLSRAAQRKLKKKEQKEAKNPTRIATAITVPETETESPKRQHSIWVGNLAFKTTEQSLRSFFERGVPGCTITRINLPTKSGKDVKDGGERKSMRGENRGFAYVDFSTQEFKEQAIALSEQNLDGRKLLIKDGNDFAGRPTAVVASAEAGVGPALVTGKSKMAQKILASQKQPPAQTLFLGNLGFQATEASIKTMLEAHMKSRTSKVTHQESDSQEQAETATSKGKKGIRKVRLGTFEDSGLCKGWAFVDFYNIEDATAVLIDPRNHHLDGRKLKVEYASAEAVRRGGGAGARAHRDNKEAMTSKDSDKRLDRRETVQPVDNLENEDEPTQKKPRVNGKEYEARGFKGKRTRPGAALAMAKRENVAIVPSRGKRTVF